MSKLSRILATVSSSEVESLAHFCMHPRLSRFVDGQLPSKKTRTLLAKRIIGKQPHESWDSFLERVRIEDQGRTKQPSGNHPQWLSRVLKVVIAFLEYEERLSGFGSRKIDIVKAMYSRKLINEVTEIQEYADLKSSSQRIRTEENLNETYEFARLAFNIEVSSTNLLQRTGKLPALFSIIEACNSELFLLRRLRWLVARVSQARYNLCSPPTLEEIEELRLKATGSNNLLLLMYDGILGMLRNEDFADFNEWKKWYEVLRLREFPIQSHEGKECFRYLVNVLVRMSSRNEFPDRDSRQLFEIYMVGMERGGLEFEGRIPSQLYLSICLSGLKSGHHEEVLRFTMEFKDNLDFIGQEEGIYHLNRALISSHLGDTKEAWRELQLYDPKGNRKLRKYVMEVKLLWILDQEMMLARIQAFIMYLRKGEFSYDKKRMDFERRRVQLIRRMAEVPISNRKAQRKIFEEISQLSADREWMLEMFRSKVGWVP